MKKEFILLNTYDGVEVIGEYDTLKEVFAQMKKIEKETDGECNLEYFSKKIEVDRKILKRLELI